MGECNFGQARLIYRKGTDAPMCARIDRRARTLVAHLREQIDVVGGANVPSALHTCAHLRPDLQRFVIDVGAVDRPCFGCDDAPGTGRISSSRSKPSRIGLTVAPSARSTRTASSSAASVAAWAGSG